jgi:endonuclease/exonuclease/phosphatase family metal-dependent hydrolase
MNLRLPILIGALVAGVCLWGGCAPATNLLSANQPAFLGQYAPARAPVAAPLRVVTFNVKESQEIDRAIAVLQGDSLRGADVVMLQEMNESGVDRIARALHLNYAYYPAVIHHRTGDYYGPAVLSRWPIERSWKVMLPYGSWDRGMRRTATAAVVRANGLHLLVYAVHLETMVKLSPEKRAEQARAVTDDAKRFAGPVVIAGDFNDYAMAACMHQEGFRWLTEWLGPTHRIFAMDHILTRGLDPVANGVGTVRQVHGASDHHPVWALLTPSPPHAAPLARSSKP